MGHIADLCTLLCNSKGFYIGTHTREDSNCSARGYPEQPGLQKQLSDLCLWGMLILAASFAASERGICPDGHRIFPGGHKQEQ